MATTLDLTILRKFTYNGALYALGDETALKAAISDANAFMLQGVGLLSITVESAPAAPESRTNLYDEGVLVQADAGGIDFVGGHVVVTDDPDHDGRVIVTFENPAPTEFPLAEGKVWVGDDTGQAAAVTLHGGATIDKDGLVSLTAGGGIAALLAAGLGNSVSYLKTKNDTTDLLAGHATKARAVLIVVRVDTAFADNDVNLQPTFSVGEESGAADKFVTVASLANKAAGTVQVYAGTQTANKKIQVTGVAASGDGSGTGAVTVTVIGIPTT